MSDTADACKIALEHCQLFPVMSDRDKLVYQIGYMDAKLENNRVIKNCITCKKNPCGLGYMCGSERNNWEPKQ